MAESSRAFRAMGSDCVVRVVVDDDRAEPILDRVETRMHDLEQRWSRFIDSSELSQLNRHAGDPVFVSPEMFAVVALAFDAWKATDGLFDPTLLDILREFGYDDTFFGLADRAPFQVNQLTVPTGGLDSVVLDVRSSLIHAPLGLHFDLGGIGKGHAADLLFAQVMEDGVSGACLDFGGDIRVGGETVEGGGWVIVIDDPFEPGVDLAVLGLETGSVTTSSRLRRKWSTTTGEVHHLIDPKTARPSESGLASVTVIAAQTAWGEAHAKAALIAGATAGRALLERSGLSGLLIADDGQLITAGQFNDFVVDGPTVAS
ncbi:MAG: FAD:protein FMN transferase [Actinobacteria bacterium]|nr:FAD:protein FMN transferase [Actinomycetota bacterium]